MTSPPILKHLQPQEKSGTIFIIHLEKKIITVTALLKSVYL